MEELFFDFLVGNKVDEALNKDCKIDIESKNGVTSCHVEGEGLTLLIVLGALEKQVLNKMKCSEKMFEILKKKIGTKEV